MPVSVPPELFSSKEVVRSLIVLGKLTAGWTDKVDAGVIKNVALSVELLLGDSNPFFQDTAIELVGYGWSAFQSLFDPFEVRMDFLLHFLSFADGVEGDSHAHPHFRLPPQHLPRTPQ